MRRSVSSFLRYTIVKERVSPFVSISHFSSQASKKKRRAAKEQENRPYLIRPENKIKAERERNAPHSKPIYEDEHSASEKSCTETDSATDAWRETKIQFEQMFRPEQLVPRISVDDPDKRMRIPSCLEGVPLLEELFLQNRDQPTMPNISLLPILTDDSILYRGFMERKFGVQRLAKYVDDNRRKETQTVKYSTLRALGEALQDPSFEFQPEKRFSFKLNAGRTVSHSVPNARDEVVLNSMRLILDAIYEPRFSEFSFGFRSDKGRQVALRSLRNQMRGMNFYIIGEFSMALQQLQGKELQGPVSTHIHDQPFLSLLKKALKIGYANSYGIQPESSISIPKVVGLSPLLVNCYLNSFDKWLEEQRDAFLDYWNPLEWSTVTDHTRPTHRRYRFIRCGSSFFIGVRASQAEARAIMRDIDIKIEQMALDPKLVKLDVHAANRETKDVGGAHFLGYEITQEKPPPHIPPPLTDLYNIQARARLRIPVGQLQSSFVKNSFMKMSKKTNLWRPCGKGSITYWPPRDIVRYFDRLTTGLMEFYALADNYYRLKYFIYVLKRSCNRTLAWKHKLRSMRKVFNKYGKDLEIKDGQIVVASIPDRKTTVRPLIKDFYPEMIRPRKRAP